jgi:hypothetical protein
MLSGPEIRFHTKILYYASSTSNGADVSYGVTVSGWWMMDILP